MNREQIGDWFATLVAEFIMNDFPLHMLVGDASHGPDPDGLAELQHMLKSVGMASCDRAADKIGLLRLLVAVRKD